MIDGSEKRKCQLAFEFENLCILKSAVRIYPSANCRVNLSSLRSQGDVEHLNKTSSADGSFIFKAPIVTSIQFLLTKTLPHQPYRLQE